MMILERCDGMNLRIFEYDFGIPISFNRSNGLNVCFLLGEIMVHMQCSHFLYFIQVEFVFMNQA